MKFMKRPATTNDDNFPDLPLPVIEQLETENRDIKFPQDPIFLDYSKYDRKSHLRPGGGQSPSKLRKNNRYGNN
jgi:hypothetical protein